MTLRELINSVDSQQYSDSALYQKLRETKPEYGANRRIQVKLVNGEVAITNVHVGSLGDILTYQIDVAPDLQVTKMQLLDEILKEVASNTFSDEEQAEFWDDFDNLQKATMDGYFRLGMVNQHKHLLKPGDQCIGGGYYHFDYTTNRILLDRESYDFGRPKWHLLETLKVPSTYRGMRIVYSYDDGFHDDFNVSEELNIEYYD